MKREELLRRRKIRLGKKFVHQNVSPRDLDLSELEFDVSKFKTGFDVGARIICIYAMRYSQKFRPRGIHVLEWLNREGLTNYLYPIEMEFLVGKWSVDVLSSSVYRYHVVKELEWTVSGLKDIWKQQTDPAALPMIQEQIKIRIEASGGDFAKITELLGQPLKWNLEIAIRLMIDLDLPIHNILHHVKLRNAETLFLEYLITKFIAEDWVEEEGFTKESETVSLLLADVCNMFINHSWITGIDSDLLRKFPIPF